MFFYYYYKNPLIFKKGEYTIVVKMRCFIIMFQTIFLIIPSILEIFQKSEYDPQVTFPTEGAGCWGAEMSKKKCELHENSEEFYKVHKISYFLRISWLMNSFSTQFNQG